MIDVERAIQGPWDRAASLAVDRELNDLDKVGMPDLTEDRNRTDIGAARALVALHGRDLRFIHGTGWHVWDGKRWATDRTGETMRRCKSTAGALWRAAGEITDKTIRDKAGKWALNESSEPRLKAMTHLGQSELGVAVLADAFDRDPLAFNVVNGTIDLMTGTLRPHRREDMITKIAPVTFDPL